jgi:hypothetical protein
MRPLKGDGGHKKVHFMPRVALIRIFGFEIHRAIASVVRPLKSNSAIGRVIDEGSSHFASAVNGVRCFLPAPKAIILCLGGGGGPAP